ncbi:MAG: STAS domain-containing protein [Phycisphaerales bacterium]
MDLPPTRKKTPLVEVSWDGPVVLIKPAGPNVGQRETPIIQEDIGPYLRLKTIKFLVLDLSSVAFMSSMGLSMCIAARNSAAAVGAQPILYGLNKDLKSLMAMMKMDKLYKVVDSQADLAKITGHS